MYINIHVYIHVYIHEYTYTYKSYVNHVYVYMNHMYFAVHLNSLNIVNQLYFN